MKNNWDYISQQFGFRLVKLGFGAQEYFQDRVFIDHLMWLGSGDRTIIYFFVDMNLHPHITQKLWGGFKGYIIWTPSIKTNLNTSEAWWNCQENYSAQLLWRHD